METVERDYAPQGVSFYYVYKALAHPERDGYVKAFTIKERLMHVREAERRFGSRIPWLCDGMTDDVKTALGGVQNAELVIDPEGRVVRRRAWSDPDELRRDLGALIGPVEHPTQVSDLALHTELPPIRATTGVLPRVEISRPMSALRIEPLIEHAASPFYVKLRAEADAELLNTGKGTLYLGFHLDPLYKVHWNNLARPLEFEIVAPKKVRVSPRKRRAPKVDPPTDSDPREFLVKVRAAKVPDALLELHVRYFACDDENTFCIPVEQSYQIHLQPDPSAGRVMARSGGRGVRPIGSGGELAARIMGFDANGDARVTRDELSERMRPRFERMDQNGDGAIDASEAAAIAERVNRVRPGRQVESGN